MFGIGFFEILVIAVLGLLVFGPEKLPEAIRTFAFGFSKAKRTWQNTRRELEQELGMDEIRREIHNAQIMENLDKNKTKNQPEHFATKNGSEVSGEETAEKQNMELGEHIGNQESENASTKPTQTDEIPHTPQKNND